METRASYILIGAFTVAGILGALGLLLWFANVHVDRQYSEYDILFGNVSGLDTAGIVTFNGVNVGKVTSINLYQKDPSQVIVRVQIDADTPINEETVAKLASQGVTGVSYVELTAGRADGAGLKNQADGSPPLIKGQPSLIESLSQDAPALLNSAVSLIKSLQGFVGPENRRYVTSILSNADKASGQLQGAISDVSAVTGSVTKIAKPISNLAERIGPVLNTLETTLNTANDTLKSARTAFDEAGTTLTTARGTFNSATRTIDTTQSLIQDRVPRTLGGIDQTVADLRRAINDLDTQASGAIASVRTASDLAGARLTDLGPTITDLDATLDQARTTLASIDAGAGSARALIDGNGTALVTDARGTLARLDTTLDSIDTVARNDVPRIAASVQTALDTANRVLDQAGTDITGFTGQFGPLAGNARSALATATDTFATANGAITRLDTTIGLLDTTLTSARGTFDTANTVIGEHVAPTAADIRQTAARLDSAITQITANIPEITTQIRDTLNRIDRIAASVDSTVSSTAPPIRAFAQSGLPQFVDFTREARGLVTQLDRLVANLQRDPARFLLGNQPPNYRR